MLKQIQAGLLVVTLCCCMKWEKGTIATFHRGRTKSSLPYSLGPFRLWPFCHSWGDRRPSFTVMNMSACSLLSCHPIIMHMAERREKKKGTENTRFDWNMDLCRHKHSGSTGVSPMFERGMKIGMRHRWSLPRSLVWVVLGARGSVPAAFLHRTCAAAAAVQYVVTRKLLYFTKTAAMSCSVCINRYSSYA